MPPLPIPPTPDAIVAEARTWIGTPFVRQAHLKGVGCDCVGFVAETLRAFGVDFEYPRYGRMALKGEMPVTLAQYLDRVPLDDLRIGDVALCTVGGIPTHLTIVGDDRQRGTNNPYSLIHAMFENKRVYEHPLTPEWRSRIDSVWRVRANGVSSSRCSR